MVFEYMSTGLFYEMGINFTNKIFFYLSDACLFGQSQNLEEQENFLCL